MQIQDFLKMGLLAFVMAISFNKAAVSSNEHHTIVFATAQIKPDSTQWFLYDSLHLSLKGLSKEAYSCALSGYNKLLQAGKIKNNETLTIIDFSLPSTAKRLFVIDLKLGEVLFNTLVSHGKNSGKDIASQFSNKANSYKSSLGFYITSNTYIGKHGLSLRLEGEEKGINDNALDRGIVMHCADYVTEDLIHSQGYIGRSEGCPAVPQRQHKAIINTIKDGSCLFIYSPVKQYLTKSKLIES